MSVPHETRVGGGETGLTFVEFLIATAISTAVLVIAGGAFSQINILTRLQQDRLTLNEQVQKATALLGHDVVSAAEGTVISDTLTLAVPVHTFGVAVYPITKTITKDASADPITGVT